jgi:lactate dehydrogenase-like 2-hydroxyacid dehydrogenase
MLAKIVMTDLLAEAEIEAEILQAIGNIKTLMATKEQEIWGHVEDADALIVWHEVSISRKTINRLKNCKIIARAGTGYDNIDIVAAAEKNIPVTNIPDYGTEEVADSAICLILNLMRRTYHVCNCVKNGDYRWQDAFGATRIRGSILGIVGLGRIGTALALRAKTFGFDLLFFDPFLPDGVEKALGIRRATTLAELLQESKIVSLNCSLSDENRYMMNEKAFKIMRRDAYLVNTARGGLVKESALINALEKGEIAGAAIDVLENEPNINPKLREIPNLYLTPHSAFYSDESFVELRQKCALEVKRVLSGEEAKNVVNHQYLGMSV